MRATIALCAGIAALANAACANSGNSRHVTLHHDCISAAEVAQEQANSAYVLVARLRPYFLRGRSGGFDAPPLVFMDDIMLGDIDALRTINARDVVEIRWRRGEEMRFRSHEASGRRVIQVITRRS